MRKSQVKMHELTPDEFCTQLAPQARLMALDVGAKTIGLATGLWGHDLVMPLITIKRTKFTADVAALTHAFRDYDVAGLVIGWPIGLDGVPGRRCQSVRDFTLELGKQLSHLGFTLPYVFWDERFSTKAGDDRVHDLGITAGKPVRRLDRDRIIDALAATAILSNFMEYHQGRT
jgi:putative Holliday junction resolvase